MRRVCFLGLLFCALGCGDDSGDMGDQDSGLMGDGAAEDAASDSSTSPPNTPPMTPPPPMPVPCGDTMCQQPQSLLGGLGDMLGPLAAALPSPMACCLDDDEGVCGIMAAGTACEPPAVMDERCPGLDLGPLAALGGNMGFGCCTEDNMCGTDGSASGRGCVENAETAEMLGPLANFLMVPAPRACDAPDDDAGVEDDGGVEDASVEDASVEDASTEDAATPDEDAGA